MVDQSEALMVEQIAVFASKARAGDMTQEIRALFKRNILDSLGCALGALPGKPFAKLRVAP
jgi:2-methylcitrate dehydratase